MKCLGPRFKSEWGHLLPIQTTTNSPSVASTVQLFDSLGNPTQTQPRKTSHTTQLDRIEEALNEVKANQLTLSNSTQPSQTNLPNSTHQNYLPNPTHLTQ